MLLSLIESHFSSAKLASLLSNNKAAIFYPFQIASTSSASWLCELASFGLVVFFVKIR